MKKRILLMHISDVSGHKEASSAIERAINSIDNNVEVLGINIFDYIGQNTSKIITRLYIRAIKNMPAIWGFLYDNKKIISGTTKIKKFVYSRGYRKIKGLIDEFKPQAVIATQAFPCGICAEYKKHFGDKFKLIGVMTDYAPHTYWFEDGIDYYIVGSSEVKQALVKQGISQSRIKTFGIPIDLKFKEGIDQEKVFEKFKIDNTKPIVLIMGGGQGLGPIKKIIKSLDSVKYDFQIILICGTNKKLETQINNKAEHYKKNVMIFGFTRNIDELMSISSLIITKAGGLTTSEALAKNLPMLIIRPIPGQEVHNTNYLVRKQVAVYVKNTKKINIIVEDFLKNRDKLRNMQKKAALISKPNSSLDIAKFALDLCQA